MITTAKSGCPTSRPSALQGLVSLYGGRVWVAGEGWGGEGRGGLVGWMRIASYHPRPHLPIDSPVNPCCLPNLLSSTLMMFVFCLYQSR